MGKYFMSSNGFVNTESAQLVLEQLLEDGRTVRYFLCLDCHDILDVTTGDPEYEHSCVARRSGSFAQNGI
jgi:hypothetical protein